MSKVIPEAPAFDTLNAAFRLRRAIVGIGDRSPSFARSVVDQFLRFVSPNMARLTHEFPITCRRHLGNPERMAAGSLAPGLWPLAYFHVGSTLLAYYDACRGKPTDFERLIPRLELIAKDGAEKFRIAGTDSVGYYLQTFAEFDAERAAAQRAADEKHAAWEAKYNA